jgi:hypothetical protein
LIDTARETVVVVMKDSIGCVLVWENARVNGVFSMPQISEWGQNTMSSNGDADFLDAIPCIFETVVESW